MPRAPLHSFYIYLRRLTGRANGVAVASCRYQLNFENSYYRSDPDKADAEATVATATADAAAEAVVVAKEEVAAAIAVAKEEVAAAIAVVKMEAAKEGKEEPKATLVSENNQFATSIEALRLQMVSLETRATEYRQVAQNHFTVGDTVSATRELQRAKMLTKQILLTQGAMDALNAKSDILEQIELQKEVQTAVESIEAGLTIKAGLLDLNAEEEFLTDADSKLRDRLDALTQDVEGGIGKREPEETLLEELQSNANPGDADGPYFKLQNQSSQAFLAVEYGGKNESLISQVHRSDDSDAQDENQLWSQHESSGYDGYFKFKHKRTGKWLAASGWNPIVYGEHSMDQLWKFDDQHDDSSLPFSFRLKNHDSLFLGEKDNTPKLHKDVPNKSEWKARDVWKAVPRGDTGGGETASNDTEKNSTEELFEELKKNIKNDADGPYFKLQNQAIASSKAFLAVEIGGKNESVLFTSDGSDAEDENQLWSQQSYENDYFKFKHKITGKWLAEGDNWSPIVYDKHHENQLWKFDDQHDDPSLPFSFKVKTSKVFLGERDNTPGLYLNGDVTNERSKSKLARYVWKAVPHGDTGGGKTESNDDTGVITEEQNKNTEKLLKELKKNKNDLALASASAMSVGQLIVHAKVAADAAVAFDKLTAKMTLISVDALQLGRVIDSFDSKYGEAYGEAMTLLTELIDSDGELPFSGKLANLVLVRYQGRTLEQNMCQQLLLPWDLSEKLVVTKLALQDSMVEDLTLGRSQIVKDLTQLLGLPVCAQCSRGGHSSPHSQMCDTCDTCHIRCQSADMCRRSHIRYHHDTQVYGS